MMVSCIRRSPALSIPFFTVTRRKHLHLNLKPSGEIQLGVRPLLLFLLSKVTFMAPPARGSEQSPKPWNTIYIADVLNAINPLICIRCSQRKATPGVNTICAICQSHLDVDANSEERFLFSTCSKIFDFFLWTRRKVLSDNYIARDDAGGMFVEQFIGLPGVHERLPSLLAIRSPDGRDRSEGKIELLTPMAQELLEHVLLTSRQCDNALVLLADILRSELLHGKFRGV